MSRKKASSAELNGPAVCIALATIYGIYGLVSSLINRVPARLESLEKITDVNELSEPNSSDPNQPLYKIGGIPLREYFK